MCPEQSITPNTLNYHSNLQNQWNKITHLMAPCMRRGPYTFEIQFSLFSLPYSKQPTAQDFLTDVLLSIQHNLSHLTQTHNFVIFILWPDHTMWSTIKTKLHALPTLHFPRFVYIQYVQQMQSYFLTGLLLHPYTHTHTQIAMWFFVVQIKQLIVNI